MKCQKCRFQNPEGVNFCGECGSELSKKCPMCNIHNPRTFKFCRECGNNLIKANLSNRSILQSYTPKHLTDKILSGRKSIEGEHKIVTVLFADVEKYTFLSGKLNLEDVHQIMDDFFEILTNKIHKYEGTINQFTGDGVMALFGAPIAHEDHAERACRAALAIKNSIYEYGKKVEQEYEIPFKIRVGLNSGPVIVGTIGDDLRMDYTAIGDTTNLSHRLETLARPGSIVISKNTHNIVCDFFRTKNLGEVEVKGKTEPQEIFELVETGKFETRIEAGMAKGLTQFVGRLNSMGTLLTACKKAKSGKGQIVGVVGEAGLGKSRLVFELGNLLATKECCFFKGHCIQYGRSISYMAILDLLRNIFNINKSDEKHLIKEKISEKIHAIDEKLKTVIPACQYLFSVTVDDSEFKALDPKKRKENIFESLRNLIIRLSEDHSLVLCIEDLHWVDRATEEFINYLIGWLGASPILLILSYRPEYIHTWGSRSYYTQIGLTELGETSSTMMVKALFDNREIDKNLMRLIYRQASGNPLYLEEYIHTLKEKDLIRKRQEKYCLESAGSSLHLPDTIQGIIAARIDRLERPLKKTVQLASVIGLEFSYSILKFITAPTEDLKKNLFHLQQLEFIYEKKILPELEYYFKHALIKEVAYTSLILKKKKTLHRSVGHAIEELYPDRLEEFYEVLTYHYFESGDYKKACHYAKLAGDKAEDQYSHEQAYNFYKQAITLYGKQPQANDNERQLIETFYALFEPMAYLGYPKGSYELIQQFERLAKKTNSDVYQARACSAMASFYSYHGNPTLGIEYAEQAFNHALNSKDIERMVPIAVDLVVSYQLTGFFSRIVNIAPDIIAMLEEGSRETEFFSWGGNPYSLLCGYCGFSYGYLGDFNAGDSYLRKGQDNAYKVGDLQTLASIGIHYGNFLLIKGDWALAVEHFQESIKHSAKLQYSIWSALAWSGYGIACSHLGDLKSGKKYIEKGLKLHRESGVETYLFIPHLNLGKIYLESGNLNKAKRYAKDALQMAQQNNEKASEGQSWTLLGRIHGKTTPPDIETAQAYILKSMDIFRELGARPYYFISQYLLGEILLELGDKPTAIEHLKESAQMFKKMDMVYWLGKTTSILSQTEP